MKRIYATMKKDWIEPYAGYGNKIPVVTRSNHPQYTRGTRLDWGFVSCDVYIRARETK